MPSLQGLMAVTSQALLWELVLEMGAKWDEFSSAPGCKLGLSLCKKNPREKPQKGMERKTENGVLRIMRRAEVA